MKEGGETIDKLGKVLMIGDSGVGKTCLIQRFDKGEFKANTLPTIAIDFVTKIVPVRERRLKMQIWDTAGQERYNTLTSSFFKSTNGVLVVFALNSRASFDSVSKWMNQIHALASKDVVVLLVGNKADLPKERQVTTDEGEALAKNYSCRYFETSAASGSNVDKVFAEIAQQIVSNPGFAAAGEKARQVTAAPVKKSKCC